MTVLAVQQTGTSTSTPAIRNTTPAAMPILLLARSSLTKLVHLPPTMPSRMPTMPATMYDSMLALPTDLQAARALSVLSIVAGVVGLLIATVGAKCTNCIVDEGAKARAMVASGATFLLAALAQLVPASWSAHSIVQEFYSPLVPSSQKMEIGAALYLGWAAASLLAIGGSILCASCPPPPGGEDQEVLPLRPEWHGVLSGSKVRGSELLPQEGLCVGAPFLLEQLE
uniref:Uncharacterized protein n=1 Tax=Gadus morhua TaxID=8049 RepID=A0A8C5FMK7_GADMO